MPAALSGALHKHGRGAGPPASGHTRPSFTQRICDRRLSRTPRARLHSAFAREIWVSNSVEGVAGRTPLSEGAGALGSAERTLDGDVVGKPPDRRRGDLRYAHPGWYAEYASGWPVPPSEQREPERCIGERPGPLPNEATASSRLLAAKPTAARPCGIRSQQKGHPTATSEGLSMTHVRQALLKALRHRPRHLGARACVVEL